jgi:hypothetical protein
MRDMALAVRAGAWASEEDFGKFLKEKDHGESK